MAKINKSLYKIQLVGGIERIPAIVLAVSLAIIGLYAPIVAKVIGILTISILWGVLIKLNAQDAIFLETLIRYVFQQRFYYAHSRDTSRIVKFKYKFRV